MPAAADCDALGAKMVTQSMAQAPAGIGEEERTHLQALSGQAGQVIARLCKTDGWTADAVSCGLIARDPSNDCDAKLTAAQKQKMGDEIKAIFVGGGRRRPRGGDRAGRAAAAPGRAVRRRRHGLTSG